MKYGFKEIDDSLLIDHFEKIDDSIKIVYLNGNSKLIANTKENTDKLIELMLKQAEERHDSEEYNEALKRRKYSLIGFLSSLGITTFCIGFKFITNANFDDKLELFTYTFGFSSIYYGVVYFTKKELQELEKYHIYLKYKDSIDTNININNIDNYSLNDLKKEKIKVKKKYIY